MSTTSIVKCGSSEEAISRLSQLIQKSVDSHLGSVFTVGLSGGSLPTILGKVLPTIKTNWKIWKFFFCDERLVPFDDIDSTFGAYKKEVVSRIGDISVDQFVTIDPSLKKSDSAVDYASKMRQIFVRKSDIWPRFDLLFLGMGPDGHTCSLFADHPLLKENSVWVAYIGDSPKPPPNRITLTLPVINNAKTIIFYTTGQAKAQVLKEIIVDQKQLPAGLVSPTDGHLYWVIDNEAAQLIPQHIVDRMSIP